MGDTTVLLSLLIGGIFVGFGLAVLWLGVPKHKRRSRYRRLNRLSEEAASLLADFSQRQQSATESAKRDTLALMRSLRIETERAREELNRLRQTVESLLAHLPEDRRPSSPRRASVESPGEEKKTSAPLEAEFQQTWDHIQRWAQELPERLLEEEPTAPTNRALRTDKGRNPSPIERGPQEQPAREQRYDRARELLKKGLDPQQVAQETQLSLSEVRLLIRTERRTDPPGNETGGFPSGSVAS
ncbi:MAG: hypothetical protein KatS3mg115_2365 [Candidatus Poribacteria bacterium]|nr:MAG: hypothetical protein KatS3mg115_2365 [Candidatus Poribacteria bacterium]